MELSYLSAQKALMKLRALDHQVRGAILVVIDQHGPCKVGVIYELLKMEQSICSAHIQILLKAGVITQEKAGKEHICSVNYEEISRIIGIVNKLKLFVE